MAYPGLSFPQNRIIPIVMIIMEQIRIIVDLLPPQYKDAGAIGGVCFELNEEQKAFQVGLR